MNVSDVLKGALDEPSSEEGEHSYDSAPLGELKSALKLDDSAAQRLYDAICEIVETKKAAKPSEGGSPFKKKLDVASVLKGK